jgi:thiamine biosynthesis lipoprotein ApbE
VAPGPALDALTDHDDLRDTPPARAVAGGGSAQKSQVTAQLDGAVARADDVEDLATSGTARRRWRRGPLECHHVVDPRTGLSAAGPWRTISVAAVSCLDANTAATASLVLGVGAPGRLAAERLPARLVGTDGAVRSVAGWPAEEDGS